MGLQEVPFGVVQLAGLHQHGTGNADLADVVHWSRMADRLHHGGSETQRTRDDLGIEAYPMDVARGVVIDVLRSDGQPTNRVEVLQT